MPEVTFERGTGQPTPISDSMRKHLDETLAKIPSTKTGTVFGGFTVDNGRPGAEIGVAQRYGALTGVLWGGWQQGAGWAVGGSGQISW